MTMHTATLAGLEIAPENPRKTIHPDHIDRLAANIAEFGLKQNLVGKAQLIEVACEIHAGQLTKWNLRKKTEIVTLLATAFDGTLIAANGAVTPELQKAIKAARSWLPPVLCPVEAKMEEAA